MKGWKYFLRAAMFFGVVIVLTAGGSYYFLERIPFFTPTQNLPPLPLSIGVVDINSIKNNSKAFQKFKGVLDNLNARIHKEILERETSLRSDYEQLKKREEDAKEPNSELIKQRLEIDKKYAALEKTVRTRREELDKILNQGLSTFKTSLQEIMVDLGKIHGLKIILNRSIGDGNQMDQSIILYCNEALDLTKEVITRLDKKLNSKNFED